MAKQDPSKLITKGWAELEAAAELMEEKAIQMKNICRQAKAAMGEVSTSPIQQHLDKIGADAVAKRRARMKRA